MVKKAGRPVILGLLAALWLIGPPHAGHAHAMMLPLDGLAPETRPFLHGIAEKKSTSTVKQSTTTRKAPSKTPIPKKTTAPKSSSTTQPSLPKKTTTPTKKAPSKTGKLPSIPGTGDVIVKERLPSKPGKTEADAPLSDAEASGGTMTTQAVTQEELEQFAEDNPDQVTDHDGDGDYEQAIEQLPDGAEITVEDDYAYIDINNDGQIDYVIPTEHLDLETGTIYIPVSPETVAIDYDGGGEGSAPDIDVEIEPGYVELDLDGDGEPELYQSWDSDGDGYADQVYTGSPVDDPQADYPEIPLPSGETAEPGGKRKTGSSVFVNISPSGTPDYAAPEDTTDAAGFSDLVQNLADLKSLFNEGILSTAEYETAQYRALASVDPTATGVEGGLRLLRDLWDQELISEAPYGSKRQEMLDAL